jgi:S-phase kinase-associated protein 1
MAEEKEQKVISLEEDFKDATILLNPTLGKDKTALNVERRLCKRSKFLMTSLTEDKDVTEISLVIDRESLLCILKYLTYFDAQNKIPTKFDVPLKTSIMSEIASKWEADFVDELSQDFLLNLIGYVNYLDIQELLDLTSCKLATLIRNKTTEEIRKQFNITNDFTPAEEEALVNELQYCEEE